MFLDNLNLFGAGNSLAGPGFLAVMLWFSLAILVVSIGAYVFVSFAFMAIARKNKQSSPGIAWIPGVGPLIIAFRAAKMHWWPWLLLIGAIIPLLNFIVILVFAVFAIIWMWKMFEAVGRPGWWGLVPSIISILSEVLILPGTLMFSTPLLVSGYIVSFIGIVLFLVFAGIAAWGKK